MTARSPEFVVMLRYLEKNGPTSKSDLLKIISKSIPPTRAIREYRLLYERQNGISYQPRFPVAYEQEMGSRMIARQRLRTGIKGGRIYIDENEIVYLVDIDRSSRILESDFKGEKCDEPQADPI